MQRSSITKCFDKQVSSILCHLYHQSRTLKNKNTGVKQRTPLLTFQNHFTNILNSILEKQILWGPYADIKHYLQDNIIGKNAAIATFIDLFKMKSKDARSVVLNNTIFFEIPRRRMHDNYQLLKYSGMGKTLIQDNILLLAEDTNDLQSKIAIVQQFSDNINYCIPFLQHNKKDLDLLAQSNYPIDEKIKYFRQQWQVRNIELYAIVSKHLHLFIKEPEEMVKKIKLLLDHEVHVDSLLKEKWPFIYTYEYMYIRLEAVSELGLYPIRPWIFNCKKDAFKRHVDSVKIDKTKMKQISLLINYLTKNSSYNSSLIKFKLSTIPLCRFQDYTESIKLINLILKEGYDFHDIIWSINMITLSEQLLTERLSKLKSINHKAPFLKDLCLSNEDFIKYVNIVKNNRCK